MVDLKSVEHWEEQLGLLAKQMAALVGQEATGRVFREIGARHVAAGANVPGAGDAGAAEETLGRVHAVLVQDTGVGVDGPKETAGDAESAAPAVS